MYYSPNDIAKIVCEESGWNVTNLQLHKMLYFINMAYAGKKNDTLFADGTFEAWQYGPVIPSLYSQLRIFGNNPVKNVFSTNKPLPEELMEFIRKSTKNLLKYSPGQLVSLTHRQNGAWENAYEHGERGIKISNDEIKREYNEIYA